MTDLFPDPGEPSGAVLLYHHDHEFVMIGAELAPNGCWYSVWKCELCPDIFHGDHVGPIPPGYCHHCGWVQKKWPRKRCEECKRRLAQPEAN